MDELIIDETPVTPRLIIDEPGLYDDLTDEEYHGDPVPWGSVSSTGLRRLLPPGNPALFRWGLDNPQPPRRTFDLGHAAHTRVLGVGMEVVAVQAEDWRTKKAQAERDEIRAQGKVPLLAREVAVVDAMATALREHPLARNLLVPGRGDAEQSAFWEDPRTGVWCRARFDWLPWGGSGPLLIGDYKTTESVDPQHFSRSVATYGYHQQRAHYEEAVRALGIHDYPVMLFIAQEKNPPYQVGVFELDTEAVRVGRERNRRALEVYAECSETGVWPSGSEEIHLISLPRWAR